MTTQEIIQFTKELIAIPSTADNPAALRRALDKVASVVAQCEGVTIERFEQNGKPSFLAYRGTERPDTFGILLNAHLDVVPAGQDQFKPREQDGKLYGRGALDMKGTAVVLTDVFCELVNQVPYALGLQIVTDEEIGGHDGTEMHVKQGLRADFVVVGEYANEPYTIYNAARGLCWIDVAFPGKAAHGGHLWHGKNAVVRASTFAQKVLEHYPTPTEETWTTTANIASISTKNTAYNKVPDQAMLKIDFRFTQGDPVFKNEQTLRDFIASIDPEAKLTNIETFEPALYTEQSNRHIQSLSKALRAVTGEDAQFKSRPAGSDGRFFAPVHSDVVEFGLYGNGSHSDHEFVYLDSFAEYRKIMLDFLRQPTLDPEK